MATTTKRKTTTEKGLGWRHQQAAAALKRKHRDGTPCDWCGDPMYLDRTRNKDYRPEATNRVSGELQADHSTITRQEAMRRGLPIPLPDRLLHQICNQQRGDGVNDHLAVANSGRRPMETETLAMAWPW